MFNLPTTILSLLFVAILNVSAQMIPSSPDGSTVARIGSQLTTMWTKDTTGKWNTVTLQLMSGDNFNMIPVTTLATGIDSTQLSSYTFTVPEVTPTSKIYFLQFTPGTGNISDVEWTTRFTIAGADGSVSEPANAIQPGGASIPWGVGQLVGGSTTGSGTGAGATGNSTAGAATTGTTSTVGDVFFSTTTSGSVSSPVVSIPVSSAVESEATVLAATEVTSSPTAMVTATRSSSASVSRSVTSATAAATSSGAAGKTRSEVGYAAGIMGAVVMGMAML